jgi:hypothetical protein
MIVACSQHGGSNVWGRGHSVMRAELWSARRCMGYCMPTINTDPTSRVPGCTHTQNGSSMHESRACIAGESLAGNRSASLPRGDWCRLQTHVASHPCASICPSTAVVQRVRGGASRSTVYCGAGKSDGGALPVAIETNAVSVSITVVAMLALHHQNGLSCVVTGDDVRVDAPFARWC